MIAFATKVRVTLPHRISASPLSLSIRTWPTARPKPPSSHPRKSPQNSQNSEQNGGLNWRDANKSVGLRCQHPRHPLLQFDRQKSPMSILPLAHRKNKAILFHLTVNIRPSLPMERYSTRNIQKLYQVHLILTDRQFSMNRLEI